jgi:hypothetical protein
MMTIEELFRSAAGGCQTAGCTHDHSEPLYLHSRCHRKRGTFVAIDPVQKTLRVECAECKKEIVTVSLIHGLSS